MYYRKCKRISMICIDISSPLYNVCGVLPEPDAFISPVNRVPINDQGLDMGIQSRCLENLTGKNDCLRRTMGVETPLPSTAREP